MSPAVQKLAKLLGDAPSDDPGLQLVTVKVLTNLSLDRGAAWPAVDVEAVKTALEQTIADSEELVSADGADERQQLLELAKHLQSRLPGPPGPAGVPKAASEESKLAD